LPQVTHGAKRKIR